MEELLDEVRLLWHAMVQAGERLHAAEPVTLGMRGILELLLLEGAAAVPAMARRRSVTRQHVQALVDALLERGLVALGRNPAHRRSALVRLTPEGRRVIDRMRRREAELYRRARLGAAPDRLKGAAEVLRGVRTALSGRARRPGEGGTDA